MAIITFISDFGLKDAYVAIVKAKLLSHNPSLSIIDISHDVEPSNLADGAFLLASTYNQFPKGSVHLTAIDSVGSKGDKFIALEFNEHFFVGTNNGLLSLITRESSVNIVELSSSTISTFPARDVLAENAAKLASGTKLEELGSELTDYKKLIGRSIRATKKEIAGTVIKIDYYGNLITNIRKKVFDDIVNNRSYTIKFGRQEAYALNTQSNEAEPGDWFVYFNHLDLLEIGIRNGNASQLLGLHFDSPVWIKFEEQ
jgi:S-adenosylmethionine hydrolase